MFFEGAGGYYQLVLTLGHKEKSFVKKIFFKKDKIIKVQKLYIDNFFLHVLKIF